MSDREYMAAVERGDMATAQRMVDHAAKRAGYTVGPVYHGSPKRFTRFDPAMIGSSNGRSEGAGFYFTTDKGIASGYSSDGGMLLSAFLKLEKPLSYDAKPFGRNDVKRLLKGIVEEEAKDGGSWKDGFLSNYVDTYSGTLANAIDMASKSFMGERSALDQIGGIVGSGVPPQVLNPALKSSLGYDSFFSKGFGGEGNRGGDIYVATLPEQVKSADPVTYDDAGNVIPLSRRFDPSSEDVRNPRHSTPPQFPLDYAVYLRRHFPRIWAAGGNIRGIVAFGWWTDYRRGVRSPEVLHWWNVTRPAWIARHFRDHRLPGVVAQIKWGTVGVLGVAGMKRVVEDAIRKGR